MKTFIAGAVALLTATAAFAQNSSQSQASADPAEKKICKTERMTGSLTRSTRTCLTKAQWDQVAEETRRHVDQLDRNASENRQAPAGAGG